MHILFLSTYTNHTDIHLSIVEIQICINIWFSNGKLNISLKIKKQKTYFLHLVQVSGKTMFVFLLDTSKEIQNKVFTSELIL